jgi:disulfide oxidoreductase YuzD
MKDEYFILNKKVYSTDMMIAYADIFKPKETKQNVSQLFDYIKSQNAWSNDNGDVYSPQQLLNDPSNKKYQEDFKRINASNLKYPIIIIKTKSDFSVANGYHRIVKAKQLGKKEISSLIFDVQTLEKFYLGQEKDYEQIISMPVFELLILFVNRFGVSRATQKQSKLTFSELTS